MTRRLKRLLSSAIAISLLIGLVAAQENEPSNSPNQPAAEEQAAAPGGSEEDLFQVPEGTPEELLTYLEELMAFRPTITSFEQYVDFQKKRATAVLEATGQILHSDTKLADDQLERVIGMKLGALSALARVGDDRAEKLLYALPQELRDAGYDDLVRPAEQVVLQDRLTKVSAENKEEFASLLESVEEFIRSAGEMSRSDVALAMLAARESERLAQATGDKKIAVDTYRNLAQVLLKTDDPLAKSYSEQFEAMARRMDLPGRPIEIEGFTLDGEPFDIKSLEKKVVLIDFWATWCGPCRAEIPKLKKLYDAYREKGFEIVGISVDRDLEALNNFVDQAELPWITLADNQPDKPDYRSPAQYYGVNAIPTMILVGRDGNVISINARGAALEESLEAIFGPIEASDDDSEASTETESSPE